MIMYNAVIPSYDTPEKKEKADTKKSGLGFGAFISQMKKLKGNE